MAAKAAKKETVYNIDSAPKSLPEYDVEVPAGGSAEVSSEHADSMVAGGLWSRENPTGGNSK